MRLPQRKHAVVEERKITAYLLSEERSEGKAAFFAAFGFTAERWETLRDALLSHATSQDVAQIVNTRYGVKYVLEGPLRTPDGRNPRLRSVWIINTDTVTPLLVTAYPL